MLPHCCYCSSLQRLAVYSSSFASPEEFKPEAPSCLAAARREYQLSNCFFVIFFSSSLGNDRKRDHARSSDSKMERAYTHIAYER